MRTTPVDLYRMGNAMSPRFDVVRERDIEMYEQRGERWVAANSGGISTFSMVGRGKHWWKLEQGVEIPAGLRVVNDHGFHWLWEPSYAMSLSDYVEVLQRVSVLFYRVN